MHQCFTNSKRDQATMSLLVHEPIQRRKSPKAPPQGASSPQLTYELPMMSPSFWVHCGILDHVLWFPMVPMVAWLVGFFILYQWDAWQRPREPHGSPR